jgi:catechol 2,3-dioxygenase-like lactoylglutathione lyase family enzyme
MLQVGIHRITSITVGVPDPAAAAPFYELFGLTATAPRQGDDASTHRFATVDGGEQLVLEAAPWRGLRRLGLGAHDEDDLARLARTAADHVVEITAERVVVREPATGIDIDVTVAAPLTVQRAVRAANSPMTVGRWNHPAEQVLHVEAPVRPSNLTHLVLGSPDQPATERFLCDLLGFQVSDGVPGIISFMRAGEVHHQVAVQAAPCPFLHHLAFEVDSVDDVAKGGSAIVEADPTRQVWGLGRHAIGSNWFWYLADPAGTFVEYAADIDRISAQDLYVPKEWSGREWLSSFGPSAPREFLEPADLPEILAAQAA